MKVDYKVKLGERLQILRKYRGYSQEYVAEVLDISVREYRRMEKGEVNVSLDTICELIDKMDYDSGFLVLGTMTVDTYLNKAMMVMPDELYNEYLEKLVLWSDEICEAYNEGEDISEKSRYTLEVVKEIAKYGMEHWRDPNLREGTPDDFFTNYIVRKTPERIKRNRIQRI